NKKNKIPIELARKVKNKVVIPEKFSWKDVPINVYINGVGEFSTDLDVEKYRPTGKTYYVNKNGSDSNNGLTEKTAFSTVHKARDMSDVVEIIIGGGVYQDSQAFNNNGTGVSGYKNLSIIGKEGEDVFLTTRRITHFTSVSGRTNVFKTTRSLVASVWDVKNKDSDGDYNKIEQVNTLDECEQNAGSYYTDGSVLYVHRVDGLKPDGENTAVFLDVENFYNSGDHVTYLENIHFEGGNDGCVKVYDNTGNAKLYAKNCTFKYSKNGNGGLNVQGVDTITEDCIASCNMKDGFNYHYVKPYRQNVIEINGVGRNNGFDGSNQNNGSTSHDGIKIIRVNGKYHNNQGPNCHDVSVDSESWNLGCESFKSRATNADRRTNYQIEGGTMFLDGCVGYESHKAIVVSSTGTMYKRKTLFDDGIKYITGVLEDY
ncbi:MAG: hypothetical protein L0K24_12755, partial [Tetragenococcus koreensis]|nr:hypothetical protein [Tetragenococcus koreensis]